MTGLKRFISDDAGSTSIEYALIATFIGLGLILSLGNVRDGFASVTNSVIIALPAR